MRSLRQLLRTNLDAFRHEWSKGRQHMLANKRRNMADWKHRTGCAPEAGPVTPSSRSEPVRLQHADTTHSTRPVE